MWAATIHAESDAAARATKFQQAEHMYSSVLCDQVTCERVRVRVRE